MLQLNNHSKMTQGVSHGIAFFQFLATALDKRGSGRYWTLLWGDIRIQLGIELCRLRYNPGLSEIHQLLISGYLLFMLPHPAAADSFLQAGFLNILSKMLQDLHLDESGDGFRFNLYNQEHGLRY